MTMFEKENMTFQPHNQRDRNRRERRDIIGDMMRIEERNMKTKWVEITGVILSNCFFFGLSTSSGFPSNLNSKNDKYKLKLIISSKLYPSTYNKTIFF